MVGVTGGWCHVLHCDTLDVRLQDVTPHLRARSAGLRDQVVDRTERGPWLKPPDGTRRVYGVRNRSVRLDDEAGRMEESSLCVKVRSESLSEVIAIKAMRNLERQLLVVPHVLGRPERVDRRSNDCRLSSPELVYLVLKIGQLPMTVRSPVASIDQENRSVWARENQRSATDELEVERREPIAGVESPCWCPAHSSALLPTPLFKPTVSAGWDPYRHRRGRPVGVRTLTNRLRFASGAGQVIAVAVIRATHDQTPPETPSARRR